MWPTVGNDDEDPDVLGRACTDCLLAPNAQRPCVGADGRSFQGSGGILIVGDAPTKDDESCGRVFVSGVGAKLRRTIADHGVTNVVYDLAVRCYPGKLARDDKKMQKAVNACRPYLHQTITEAEPERIICVGAKAARSIIGAHVPLNSVRRGYTWLYNNGKKPIPVFFLNHPLVAAYNKFWGAQFTEDLAWALKTEHPQAPPWHAHARQIQTPEDAQAAYEELSAEGNKWVTFDFETAGKLFDNDFEATAVAACVRGSDSPFVWSRLDIYDDELIWPLQKLLKSKVMPKVGQYVKYDMLCSVEALGVEANNIYGDTRLWQKIGNPEADADLDKMSHLIGMGGHKEEMKKAMDAGLRTTRKLLTKIKKEEEARKLDPSLPKVEYVARPDGTIAGESIDRLGEVPMWPGVAGQSPLVDKYLRDGYDPKRYKFALVDEDMLLRYCARDVVSTDRLAIYFDDRMQTEPETMQTIWKNVIKPLTPALAKVEEWGMPANRKKIEHVGRFFEQKLRTAETRLAPYEVNLNSPVQLRKLLYNRLGLKATKFTNTGAASTDAEALNAIQDQHPIVSDILTFRKYDKLYTTYSVGLADHIRRDKRIHPNVKPDGARSGRLSCVAPWTLVTTHVGLRPIKDIKPGTFVWTHKGRWKRATRHIDQGIRPIFDVRLSNGHILSCTSDHRLLTVAGKWVSVGELYERVAVVGSRAREPREGLLTIPADGTAIDHSDDSRQSWRDLSHCFSYPENVHTGGRAKSTTEASLLCLQNGQEKSHEGEERQSAPQLQRGVRGRLRLLDLPLQREAGVCSQSGHDGIVGAEVFTRGPRRSPYRQRPNEQRPRQPGTGHTGGPHGHPLLAGEGHGLVSIEAIDYRGDCQVYDLSVADDESYATEGVFSHNCTEPNLQNIPSEKEREGQMLRDCFVAEEGNVIVSLDYSQIELRIAAMLSGDPVMREIYVAGDDFHMRTAKLISKMAWGINESEVKAKHRRAAKTFNFGLLYGMGDGRLARNLGITVREARQVRQAILGSFKGLAKFIRACEKETQQTGYTWTWWNGQRARRRPLFGIADRDEKRKNTAANGAFNTPVQGTASEFNTASLIECVDWITGDMIPARLIIPIHDSLMFEVGESDIEELVEGASGIMTQWNSDGIPLIVDTEFGTSWGTMRLWNCEECGVKTPNLSCRHGSMLTDEHKKLCCDCVDAVRVKDAEERLS